MANTQSSSHFIEFDEFYDVKGSAYRLEIVPFLDYEDHSADGYVDTENKTIKIKASLTDERKLAVLLHELGHAVLCEVGVHQTSLDTDLEEIIVEAMSSVISTNFNLVKRVLYNRLKG